MQIQKKRDKILNFSINKRQKFVFITSLLTIGLIFTQVLGSDLRFVIIGILALFAYFLTAWGLKEELSGVEWFTLLILPAMYTLAIGFSYFLLPVRWITRLPIALLYAVGFYALLLTENIYNVAAARTIQLLRAAHAVGFLLTLITAFLLFQTLLSFHLQFWWNSLGVFVITLPLIFQALWAVRLEQGITRNVAIYSIFFSILCTEITLVFSFWPVNLSLWALFLVAVIYAFLGVGQQQLMSRLSKRTVFEFFLVPVIVVVVLIVTARWGG